MDPLSYAGHFSLLVIMPSTISMNHCS